MAPTLETLESVGCDTARYVRLILAAMESQFLRDDGLFIASLADWDTLSRFYLEV